MAPGRAAGVVIDKVPVPVPAMTMVKSLVADCWGVELSVTLTVKVAVPTAVGVPETTPEAVLKLQ